MSVSDLYSYEKDGVIVRPVAADYMKKELEAYLSDNTHSWVLQSDGRYVRCNPSGNQHARNAQAMLLEKLTNPTPVR